MELEVSQQIFVKSIKWQIFLKIRPVDTVLLHADGRTGMTKVIVAFFFL